MLKSRLMRRVAVLTLAAAPLGAVTSVVGTAIVGTPAAHATTPVPATTCITIWDNAAPTVTPNPTPTTTPSYACPKTPAPNTVVAINICQGSGTPAPPTGTFPTTISVPDPTGHTWVIWGNLSDPTSPTGVFEVTNPTTGAGTYVGFASQQTGC